MLHLNNKTPFELSFTAITGADGCDALAIYLSASCQLIEGRWRVCDEQIAAPLGDEPWDPEAPSSIRFPSQVSFDKPATDIIVNGAAVVPEGKTATALQAGVEVANLKAAVNVYGERIWHHGQISAPKPFERIPLILENAFGGSEWVDEEELRYLHNPFGMGWRPETVGEAHYHGVLLPHIEWPDQLIQRPKDRPQPAGFGAVPVQSPSRVEWAGSWDEQWQQQRAPFVPDDFNPRFFCAAIPALQYPGELPANAPVRLSYLNRQPEAVFELPGMRPTGLVTTRDGEQPLTFTLQTVVIESEALIVRMFWQAFTPIKRTVADIYEMKVLLSR